MNSLARIRREPAQPWSAADEIARLNSKLSASMELTTEIVSLSQQIVRAFNDAPGPGRDYRLKMAIGMLEQLVGQ